MEYRLRIEIEATLPKREHTMADGRQLIQLRVSLALLICIHIFIFCVSLFYTSFFHPEFHVYYDGAGFPGAFATVAGFLIIALLFVFADFSFGYLVSYSFYTMIAGYLWINHFTDLNYDRSSAAFSAVASAVAFFVPALFLTRPVKPVWTIPLRALDTFLRALVLLAAMIIIVGASYNFRISFGGLTGFRTELFSAPLRNELKFPPVVGYLIGITSSTLLPFAFACFAMRGKYWYGFLVVLLLALLFPITLSKLSLFTPLWLIIIAIIARFFEIRVAVIISLLVPMLSSLLAVIVSRNVGGDYFDLANFRLMTIPANALGIYNDFFAHHEPTGFCQIRLVKLFVDCPYQEQLGIVMQKAYGFGNYNASLFATEGIASVGVAFAPVAVFACGLIIAIGNRVSAGLPPQFILISSSILAQDLLNVPLSTALLTHGAVLLFFLWYVTPRAAFGLSAFSNMEMTEIGIEKH
jgi:hypothetical protein